jgi:hypothetical protein
MMLDQRDIGEVVLDIQHDPVAVAWFGEFFGAGYQAAPEVGAEPMLTEPVLLETHLAARHLSILLRYFESIF